MKKFTNKTQKNIDNISSFDYTMVNQDGGKAIVGDNLSFQRGGGW